jgi:Cu+-exporting ATPase
MWHGHVHRQTHHRRRPITERRSLNAMTTHSFAVTGMHCASCGMLIDETLEDLPGVSRSQTSVRAGRTTVEADPSIVTTDAILAAIKDAGYDAAWAQQ